ncbi:MAG: hypothetical protein ACYDGM_07265 [Vulcanimicrobiaceae bacterium]
MNPDTSNALGVFGGMLATIFIIGTVITIFFVWCFWRVFQRAGFNGALGLLCLIPSIGPLICLLILAFSTWPTEQQGLPPSGLPMA